MQREPRGIDFPNTFGDGLGCLIDWSGNTGVWVCLDCHEQGGPAWTVDDTKQGATEHRQSAHKVDGKNTMKPEAIAASKHTTCEDCEKPAKRRNLCSSHERVRQVAWLRENKLLGEKESFDSYLKELTPTYTSPRWANFKPKDVA